MLVSFKLDAHQLAEVQVIASQPQDVGDPKNYIWWNHRKIFSGFFVTDFIFLRRAGMWLYIFWSTSSISVLRFGRNWQTWKIMLFFVGDRNSWCLPTSKIHSRNNSIYFTDDNWDSQMFPGVVYGGHDVGVFLMARRVVAPLPFGLDNPCYYFRPIWVTPSLCR